MLELWTVKKVPLWVTVVLGLFVCLFVCFFVLFLFLFVCFVVAAALFVCLLFCYPRYLRGVFGKLLLFFASTIILLAITFLLWLNGDSFGYCCSNLALQCSLGPLLC